MKTQVHQFVLKALFWVGNGIRSLCGIWGWKQRWDPQFFFQYNTLFLMWSNNLHGGPTSTFHPLLSSSHHITRSHVAHYCVLSCLAHSKDGSIPSETPPGVTVDLILAELDS